MAPAIREVTRTIIEADTTFVNVITLGYHKAYPTLNLVTSTVTTSSTVIQVDSISTPAPEENQIRLVKRSDLSDANKGAIVGTILGVIVFLLLLYYCYICWLQSRGLTPRSVKVALDPQDSTASDPPPSDPDNPPEKRKKKKNVTISSDLPHYLPRYSGSKDTRNDLEDWAADAKRKIGTTGSLHDSRREKPDEARTGETESEEASETQAETQTQIEG
ncbi:unnamed protein product [Penicillium glandicola]